MFPLTLVSSWILNNGRTREKCSQFRVIRAGGGLLFALALFANFQ